MALSAKRVVKWSGMPHRAPAIAAAGNDTYYKGAALIIDGNGQAAVPSDGAAQYPAGIFNGKDDTGRSEGDLDVASGAHPLLELEKGKVWLPLSGAAETDKGELAYLADDADLTQSAGSKTIAFLIEDVDATNALALIDLENPIKVS